MSEQAPVAPIVDAKVEPSAITEPPKVEAPKEKDQFAEKLEILAKKERMVAREKMRIAQEKRELDESRKEYNQWKELKQGAKKNPLKYIAEAGLSYDELTQHVINGGTIPEEDKFESLRGELESIKAQRAEDLKKQQEEAQKAQSAQYEQVINNFKEEITDFVETNKDTYELISQRDATEEIYGAITEAFNASVNEWRKNGQLGPMPKPMSIKDAADVMEEFYESEVKRLTETNKWKTKYGSAQQKPEDKKGPSPTLTNQMNTSSAPSLLPAKTEADRIRRALAKLEG